MKRTALPRSPFVRHSPFPPLKRKAAAESGADRENGSQGIVAPRKGIRRVGKRGQEWISVRTWLKRHFRHAGIVTCEARLTGCWFDNALSFGHCKKRRELLDGEIYHVALLCTPCHDQWEVLPHEEMHTKIHEIIDRRGLIAPTT